MAKKTRHTGTGVRRVVVNWNIKKGQPSKILPTLIRSVAQYNKSNRRLKIGITNDPERRAREYGNEYDEMVVLYKTSQSSSARQQSSLVRQLERELVLKYWIDCDNVIGGGGGPVKMGKPPYYLYIVRSKPLSGLQLASLHMQKVVKLYDRILRRLPRNQTT